MTITEFLLARIAEDEDRARGLAAAYERDEVQPPARLIQYYALVIPARVLAECEAKRRIVELHRRVGLAPIYQCGSCGVASQNLGQVFPCKTLRALAVVYADHSDYDPAWRDA